MGYLTPRRLACGASHSTKNPGKFHAGCRAGSIAQALGPKQQGLRDLAGDELLVDGERIVASLLIEGAGSGLRVGRAFAEALFLKQLVDALFKRRPTVRWEEIKEPVVEFALVHSS
ncbi:MAG: hypothetical protein U0987_11370 [Afipia sp.]|nr:hypothetical protein [Afipia sp.]